jgi:hypothetical protein
MTTDEARAVLEPTDEFPDATTGIEAFVYHHTTANRIGEFPTDDLALRFFAGRLVQIEVAISGYQNEIFEALRINYGESTRETGWERDGESVNANCWHGEKVTAAILAPPGKSWDRIKIFDEAAWRQAREYADRAPERAAMDFTANGFKSLTMGMRLQDVPVWMEYLASSTNPTTRIATISFFEGDWLRVGPYPLTSVSAEFFQDRLYRIDLRFHYQYFGEELFQTFSHRFGPLADNIWMLGNEKVGVKSGGTDKFHAIIMAPSTTAGGPQEWNTIVLLDRATQREAMNYKLDAPKRAARDL